MTDDVTGTPASEPSETLSAEAKEVEKLSDRDIKWRAKYKESLSELETVKAQTESQVKAAADQAKAALTEKSQVEARWMEAEVKAEAIAAGIKDLDLVKLIDTASLKVGEDGKIIGIKEAINDFKAKKPAFFGEDKKPSSSTNAPLPTAVTASAKSAWDYSKEEWQKSRHRFMAGIFD
jgi:hypothetical protein